MQSFKVFTSSRRHKEIFFILKHQIVVSLLKLLFFLLLLHIHYFVINIHCHDKKNYTFNYFYLINNK